MATVYTFIATRTSYATTIPQGVTNIVELVRRVRGALLATASPTRAGELRDYPLAVAVPNFLLCDGSEIAKIDFPELADYLTQDVVYQATDPLKFKLPNYVGAKTQAATAPVQTIDAGSTSTTSATPAQITPTEPGEAGGTTDANVVSGGRPRTLRGIEQEQ